MCSHEQHLHIQLNKPPLDADGSFSEFKVKDEGFNKTKLTRLFSHWFIQTHSDDSCRAAAEKTPE